MKASAMKAQTSWLFYLRGGFMNNTVCKRTRTVQFWDGYAKWYRLWIEHNNYHDRIIESLTAMVEPGWQVLDIGAGNGVLSLPLCVIGCDVLAVEPSSGMRHLLYESALKRGIEWLKVDDRRWEDIPVFELKGYDLIIASNSLHLTEMGFVGALEKIFQAKPKNVFIVSELGYPEIKVKWVYGDYQMLFTRFYEIDSSFAYHSLKECFEHWSFKKGRALRDDEFKEIKKRLIYEEEHLWLKDMATVGMYWWSKSK